VSKELVLDEKDFITAAFELVYELEYQKDK
jgi:hypothetical protein